MSDDPQAKAAYAIPSELREAEGMPSDTWDREAANYEIKR
jgi:hypothetical protein